MNLENTTMKITTCPFETKQINVNSGKIECQTMKFDGSTKLIINKQSEITMNTIEMNGQLNNLDSNGIISNIGTVIFGTNFNIDEKTTKLQYNRFLEVIEFIKENQGKNPLGPEAHAVNRILYYESSRGCPFSCSY